MNMNLQKKEDDKGLTRPVEQEQLDNTSSDEMLPEFDVIGTGLNGI